jgi:hypothetical protein
LVERRGDLGLGFVPVQIDHVVAVPPMQLELLLESGQVSGIDGHREFPAPFDLGIDIVALQRVGEALGVVVAEAFERLEIVREDALGVGEAVHDRGGDDAAGAAGGAMCHLRRFDQNDVAARVGLLGLDRRPEPREAAADDDQVGLAASDQGPFGRRRRRIVQPQREESHVTQGAFNRCRHFGPPPTF